MNYLAFTALVNGLTSFSLGLYVGTRNALNRSYTFFAHSVFFWSFGYFFWQLSTSVAGALFWARVLMAGAILIPITYFNFSLWLTNKYYEKKAESIISYFVGAVFLILNSTPLIVKGISPNQFYDFWPVPGLLYPAFLLMFFYYVLYSLFMMYAIYRRATGSRKAQLLYVFLGTAIGFAGGSTNYFLWYGIPIRPLANILVMVYPILLAYAISKHRLMSIAVVIQRSTVYAVATVLIMVVYALAVIVSETFFRQILGYSSLLITAAAALLIAVIYQPLVRIFQDFTDRIFFRHRYDYQKILKEISHRIASVIRLEELTKLIVSSFIDTMKVAEISFLLQDKEKEHFRSVLLSIPRYQKIEMDIDSPIVSWLSATKDILVGDEVEDEISRQSFLGAEAQTRLKGLAEVRDEMERLGISIWVPIISKEELIGIIALGNKLSGDIFTTEDIGLLSTLASQAAVALDNARLYNEVVNMKDYSEEILQSMVNGVMTVDMKGKVVTYNLMAEKIIGRKASEVVGKSWVDIWGRRGEITKVIENTLKDRCYINYESSIASPERGLVPVSFSSTILRDHQGKRNGALIAIQDLSEVRELEEKVRRADKLQALATMAAGMAHEIKNPLSSMKVLSQLLPMKFDDPEFRKKLKEIMPREINRIDRIVESLLGFARATAPTFEKININEILEENVEYFRSQAAEADIEIIANYGTLPAIEVDRGQLLQVFSNLILNAIQAMPNGGKLTIKTYPGKKIDEILQNIKIQFSDTGHGMTEEAMKKLFDPFYTTKYGGTGLGLTITHNIIDGHRGYIDLQSKVGQGTTFTVTLPLTQGLL